MTKHWMAVYTKPRSEKKVAERLRNRDFEVYCPLQTTLRQWSDRRKKVKTPVFPSYVFVFISKSDRLEVLQDPGILNFVFSMGKPAIIHPNEIEAIKLFLNEDGTNKNYEIQQYKKGDAVDFVAGPFINQKGIVESINKSELILLIKSLGMTIKVRTNPTLITKHI